MVVVIEFVAARIERLQLDDGFSFVATLVRSDGLFQIDQPSWPRTRQDRLGSAALRKSVDFRLRDRPQRREKIEIAAFVGLPDMLGIKCPVTARVAGLGLLPGSPAFGNFRV